MAIEAIDFSDIAETNLEERNRIRIFDTVIQAAMAAAEDGEEFAWPEE